MSETLVEKVVNKVKKVMKDTRVWYGQDSALYLRHKEAAYKKQLDNCIYKLCKDKNDNYYLSKLSDKFTFDYKIYGLETDLMNRVIKTYDNSTGNLGVLLNGIKGTGKTVTSKLISNKLDLPVIVVDGTFSKEYLNSIPQDIVIFIDEYEKSFGKDSSPLTIMDGVANAIYRRVFLLTTNKLDVNENLIQRPSRIRYIKTFKDLKPILIKEVLDDVLEHKELMKDTILFITSLEIITVDIIKSVANEVNIHHESPFKFADVFNVKQIEGKYDVFLIDGDKQITIKKSAKVSPRKDRWEDQDDVVGAYFYIENDYIGSIIEDLSNNTIKVKCEIGKDYPIIKLLGLDPIKDAKKTISKVFTFKIENSFMTNSKFKSMLEDKKEEI